MNHFLHDSSKKKPLSISWDFFLSLLTKELQHSSLKKSDTASLCIAVHWSVNTEALCFKWPRVAVWLLGRSVCVPPASQPANRDPQVSPFISFFVPSGAHTSAREQAHAHVRAGRMRRDPHTNGCVAPCRHSDLTRFTYGGAITVPTRISAESCRSCSHMFIRSDVRSIINSILKG